MKLTLYPINSAATRNPYKYLYGFVEAAGLMGYPLGRKGVLTTEDNLDNILDGIYWSTNTNVPENNPSGTYNNIYIQISNTYNRNDRFQIMFSANNGTALFRFGQLSAGNNWSSWRAFSFLQ